MIAEFLKRKAENVTQDEESPPHKRTRFGSFADFDNCSSCNKKRKREVLTEEQHYNNIKQDRCRSTSKRCLTEFGSARNNCENCLSNRCIVCIANKSKRLKLPNTNHKDTHQLSTQSAINMASSDESKMFNSFLFWKPCLPDIEQELSMFFQEQMETSDSMLTTAPDDPQFNTFNFWKAPIPPIHPDMDLEAVD